MSRQAGYQIVRSSSVSGCTPCWRIRLGPRKWGPRQVAITPGLRDAAGDGLLRDAAQQVVARIDARAGEVGVLAKSTVLEIVHDQGQRLQAAAHARAEAVYA